MRKLVLLLALLALVWTRTPIRAEIAYFTDPEGNWETLQDFLSRNENFVRGADGLYHLKPGAHFVFGGDAPDRGAGTFSVGSQPARRRMGDQGKRCPPPYAGALDLSVFAQAR